MQEKKIWSRQGSRKGKPPHKWQLIWKAVKLLQLKLQDKLSEMILRQNIKIQQFFLENGNL